MMRLVMFGIKLLHSDDFIKSASSFGCFLAIMDKQTNKNHVYNLSTQVQRFELIDIDQVANLANSVQNGAISATVGTLLVRAGVLPALVALSIGAGLPNRTKDAYVCHIEFDDSKSAILLQLSKHKYQQFLKHIA
ncbi:hypothetical protein [Moraxella catarrhalis]|uniref:Uncharacterized protein n=1 Tax=Siphoviridae sp. ctCfI1 TaxID=2827809 RepID=A0A8S5SRH8_9CAUD|nr:hypothetical protein [Moraxella catarrhalis]DAF53566.1 MAG TPA: hypothetical protein [Siphoviridae sp. ctCfI1]